MTVFIVCNINVSFLNHGIPGMEGGEKVICTGRGPIKSI